MSTDSMALGSFVGLRFPMRQGRCSRTARVGCGWSRRGSFISTGGIVVSRFELKGLHGFQSFSEDSDGTLWVGLRGQDAPLCTVREQGVQCFGRNEGIPLDEVRAVLPDGDGGLWLGGSRALIHWRRGGVSETYRGQGPGNSPNLLTRDGTLWPGLFRSGPGLGLQRLSEPW